MRYRAAVGVGEEAHSRQRHWCPWSKPVNVETWGHVPYPVVMAHAFAELRYGIVARQHENGFKCGYISAQTLYVYEAQDRAGLISAPREAHSRKTQPHQNFV